MKNLIKKYPVVTYYIIAFGWTWAIVMTMILSGQVDVNTPSPFFIIGGLMCNISPSIAAFIVTRITEGKEGNRRLREGFMKKAPARLYVLALLTVPAITAITAFLSSQTLRHYQFQITAPMIAMGLIWPLFSGFGEEFGWRGYLLPKMITRHGLLKAGIILGIIWEVWHLPMHYLAYKDFGSYLIPAFLVIGFANLTLQTVIMAYLFKKSGGSLRLMIIYHYTITASSIILGALFKIETTPQLTVYEGIISVLLFFVFTLILYKKNNKKYINTKEEN